MAPGDQIPIERRAAGGVTAVFGHAVAPEGTAVQNPAFDVTPARYVTAIITENGVARAPYEISLKKIVGGTPCSGEIDMNRIIAPRLFGGALFTARPLRRAPGFCPLHTH